MASFTKTTQYNNYTLRLDVSESIPQDSIQTNKTEVNWTLYIVNNGQRFNINNFSYKVNINGSERANYYGVCNTTDVSANGGVHYLNSGSLEIEHENDGSKTVYCSAECNGIGNGYGPGYGFVDGNLTLSKIDRLATITKANDFNDEQNPYMEFTNPANFKVNLRLEFSGSIISRNGLQTPGGYTFELTEAERKLLRQKCTANTLTVRYVVATLVDGTNESLWSYVDKTMTLINANPEFYDFTFKDINETTVALTGNGQNIIKGVSNVEVTIPVANKAIAKKETTMNKYRFTCGDKADGQSYSDTADVNLTINGVPNGTFTVYATDKRDNSTPATKLANQVVDYSPLTKISIEAYRSGGVSEEVILKLEGTIDEVDFGTKKNSIIYAYYQYSVAGSGEWSNVIEFTPEVNDGKFTYNAVITGDLESKGFNISNSYEIQVMVFDELSAVTFTDTFGSGIPNLAYHKNGVSVMGKYDVEVGGKFQVGGKCYDHNVMTIFAKDRFGVTVISQTPNKLNGLTSYLSVGDKLTYLDSSIRIGGGISKVLVSGAISFWHSTNFSQSILMITKNGQAVLQRYNQSPSDQYETESIVLSPVILEVSEGDEIALNFYSGAEQTVEILTERKDTNLTIEVIE